jgi:Na+/proline symporter
MREGVGMKAYLLAGIIWLPIPIVAGFLGLAAPTIGINITRPDVVGPLVAANILGYAGGVLVFIVVFCSLASSIDSLLAATSDVVTKEVIQPLFMPGANDAQIRKIASVVIVFVGLVTWAVCLPKVGTLATVLFFAGPLVGSTIWPIIAGLFWKRVNANGAVLAMLLGSSIGLFAYFQIGWYTASLIGTAVSFLTVIGTTLLRPHTFDWRTLEATKEAVQA